jgi:signal transduction histidine kinase
MSFRVSQSDPDGAPVRRHGYGRQVRLQSGELLFVGADIGEARLYVLRIVRALWGAGVLVIVLGLAGGLVVSRNVSRGMAELNAVVAKVESGDLRARAAVRGVRDEYDELAAGLNAMLDRLERLMGGLRHAGDAIAHDLRSPLTRLRARLEAAMIEVEAGKADPVKALAQALEDSDQVLRTFNAVLAISRLQASGSAAHLEPVDPAALARDVADLYQPLCEDKGVEFSLEVEGGLVVRAEREFLSQALANLIDNAAKYTPSGGAVKVRARRRASGEIELSVTDTGPGVAEVDRARVFERFVRLETSRSQAGAGLGLSLVAAVAEAHRGRVELSDGPGLSGGLGPGLRAALILPAPV